MVTVESQSHDGDTLPKLLRTNCRQWGSKRVALRKKEFGIWRESTWQDGYNAAKAIYLGLAALGLKPQERVCILGQGCPEWLWSELALQTLGATTIGPAANRPAEDLRGLLAGFKPAFMICQDQEQVDKALEIDRGRASLRKIIYWRRKGLEDYANPELIWLEDVVRLGKEYEAEHPGDFERSLESTRSDDAAIVLLSRDARGAAGLFPATHRFLLSTLAGEGAKRGRPREYVSLSPPGSFFEQALGFAPALAGEQIVSFVEKAETAMRDLREISPSAVVLPAATWNSLASSIKARESHSTWLKRQLLSYGLSAAGRSNGSGHPGMVAALNARLARGITIRPMRDRVGIARADVAYSTGDGLSEEAAALFRAAGVRLEAICGTPGGVARSCPNGEIRLV